MKLSITFIAAVSFTVGLVLVPACAEVDQEEVLSSRVLAPSPASQEDVVVAPFPDRPPIVDPFPQRPTIVVPFPTPPIRPIRPFPTPPIRPIRPFPTPPIRPIRPFPQPIRPFPQPFRPIPPIRPFPTPTAPTPTAPTPTAPTPTAPTPTAPTPTAPTPTTSPPEVRNSHLVCHKAEVENPIDFVKATFIANKMQREYSLYGCRIRFKTAELCVPSTKILKGDYDLFPDVLMEVDPPQELKNDFICYNMVCRIHEKLPERQDAADQFGTKTLILKRAQQTRVCVPAWKLTEDGKPITL